MTDCFDTFSLSQPILRALAREGYTKPTPVQQAAIPPLLSGKDLLACAQTGTGKTAAFSLPLLEILSRSRANGSPRALILTPTRELAQQIGESIERYGRYLKLHSAILVGGVAQGPQVQALRRRPEIIVATPGRLLDLLNQGYVKLSAVEFFVLDEADRMLDMGFLPDVRRVLGALSPKRQTMLFSATMPKEIAALAAQMLNNPESVSVAPPASVAENIEQKVLFVRQERKNDALSSVLKDKTISRALVFTRTKHRADRIARLLLKNG
ncbi:MAG TPA: DEAD/DEAH box helicase, partial [Oligoflexia bacterium]|nr:DEAD/DEAH box helicase [Oligoflexia bacterium]